MAVEQACDVIHAYSHVISQYINYSNNLSDQDADDFGIVLQANEAKKLKFSVISLTLHILSRKFEKQGRVEFFQKTVTINGLIEIYLLFNFANDSQLRRVCGSFLYYLIADSKELAKYIFDKVTKKITTTTTHQLTGASASTTPCVVFVNQPHQILQISHVTLNAALPDEVLERMIEEKDYLQKVCERVNRCILEDKDGKVNSKKLNGRIFWFEPRIERFEEFNSFNHLPDLHSEGMDARRLENIINYYLVEFPDPHETVIGLNLFFNQKSNLT